MIEFFKEPNIDWMGKAKYFYGLSAILLIAGLISWLHEGGLRYGIDFKGGTNVDIRFAQPPNIDQIRDALRTQGLGNSEIQAVSSGVSASNSNEVLIFVEQKEHGDEASDKSKAQVLTAVNSMYGSKDPGKPDFNSNTTTPASLSKFLTEKDPLAGTSKVADYDALARRLLAYRDGPKNGLLSNFYELRSVEGATPAVISLLKANYAVGNFAVRGAESVGPKVGAELRKQAIYVTLYALAGMLVYIAFRFEWVFGAAAVLAVFHDVLITLGFFSILHFEISLTVIAALLTLVGYSMNDTIVIFDRIRENNRLLRKEPFADVVNKSINQTLSRTILTSGLTFLTVLVLFLMGGQVLRAFAFALVVGIVIGTYSSFGIAAPLVVAWNKWRGQGQAASAGPAAGSKARGS